MNAKRSIVVLASAVNKIKAESFFTSQGLLKCRCGKNTKTRCFFRDGGLHGACGLCGELELVQLPTGGIVSRIVCERCCRHQYALWKTATLIDCPDSSNQTI